jgi:uncharacterized protein YndB with AHSA1/START domain
VPVTRVVAVVSAPPSEVWRTVADPHQLPRWWPRVERVEGVDRRGFTQVLRSDRGAVVRADFVRAERIEPRVVGWSQELEGTPFANLLSAAETRIDLEHDGSGGTRIQLQLEQRLQGKARLGGMLVRRAARRQLRAALERLCELHAEPGGADPGPTATASG